MGDLPGAGGKHHHSVPTRNWNMKRFDPKVIPYMAALTTAIMLMKAAVDHFGIWGWAIGAMAGLVASFSLAVAGSRISDIAQKRKPLAYASLALMVVISPIVIALSDPTPDAATWAWAMFPDAAILLASTVTGKSLLAKDEPAQPATKPKRASYKPAKPAFICSVAGCTAKPFGSQSALNAHQRKHKP
jgi:hypothetical protein